MRAYQMNVFCECGHAMYQEGKTLVCRFLLCKHYGKLFKAPSVELEPVEDEIPQQAIDRANHLVSADVTGHKERAYWVWQEMKRIAKVKRFCA